MTLSTTILRVFTVGAILSCAIPGAWSQVKVAEKPAKTAPVKAPKAKTATKVGTKTDAKAKPTGGAAAATETVANKRDPFAPLITEKKETGSPEHLPPGKAGLVVATVRVDGTIKSPEGMLAMVSNPEQHVYFIHEGDQLYDGDVEKIAIDGVTFRENSKDAFGKPVERLITKRLYPSAGEQQ
jgi:Tfp pilus assembly protein PilP